MAIGNFIKHYNTVGTSSAIQTILRKGGLEAYARYWLLLELLSQKFDGTNEEIILNKVELCAMLKCKPSKLIPVATQLQVESKLVLKLIKENELTYHAPILSDLLHRDYKRARTERVQSAPKNKDIRIKKEEADAGEEFAIPDKIMQTLKMQWMYPENIIHEVSKEAWLLFTGNPDPKKNWDRFLVHYFKNEKDHIRNALIEKSKSSEKSYKQIVADLFAEEDANV